MSAMSMLLNALRSNKAVPPPGIAGGHLGARGDYTPGAGMADQHMAYQQAVANGFPGTFEDWMRANQDVQPGTQL